MTSGALDAIGATGKTGRVPGNPPGRLPGRAPVRPVDHRDAIWGGNPLARLGGLALEFVTKVVAAPLSLFLVLDENGSCRLAVVKVEPILTADPTLVGEEFLEQISGTGPILGIGNGFGQARVMDIQSLRESEEFIESPFVTEFLTPNGFGPVLVLQMKEKESGHICVVVLVRPVDERDFNDREKGFLRQMAPFLSQSWSCASDAAPAAPAASPGGFESLTRRELEVAHLVATGAQNCEIAGALHIAAGTVKCHVRNIYAKLGVGSRVHLSLLFSER